MCSSCRPVVDMQISEVYLMYSTGDQVHACKYRVDGVRRNEGGIRGNPAEVCHHRQKSAQTGACCICHWRSPLCQDVHWETQVHTARQASTSVNSMLLSMTRQAAERTSRSKASSVLPASLMATSTADLSSRNECQHSTCPR